MSGKNNLYHVEFEQGYYNETIADTFEQYLEEEGKNSMCPECDVFVAMPDKKHNYFEKAEDIDGELKDHWLKTMKCFKNFCKPTKMQASIVAKDKFVVEAGETAMVSYGIAPYLSRWSPYHGALYTVVLALAKLVACGGDYRKVKVSFEEYYKNAEGKGCESCGKAFTDSENEGKKIAALLGAYEAKKGFGLEDIEDQAVVELADGFLQDCYGDTEAKPDFRTVGFNVTKEEYTVATAFKKPDNKIVRFCIPYDKYDRPIYEEAMVTYKKFHKMVKNGYIQSAYAVGIGGTMEALAKMSYDRNYGVRIDEDIRLEQLSQKAYGAIVAEIKPRDIRHIEIPCMFLGEVIEEPVMMYHDEVIELDELYEV